MDASILNGVGKKMRNGYLNGQISEDKIRAMYNKNKKEADSFSLFGYKQSEISKILKETHNPLLKQKLQSCLDEKKEISKRSNTQNELSISKLNAFKTNACGGIGLRKVIRYMHKVAKMQKDSNAEILSLLLDTEYANLSAKQYRDHLKEKIYERKSILLYQMADKLESLGWKYGINDEAGKNACYLVYVYLPNGVQLTWHSNEYDLYKHYPIIDDEWDGQVCMTMEKILSYIERMYLNNTIAA